MKENMCTSLQAMRACWASRVFVRIEAQSVFAGGAVVGDCAGHATKRADVVHGESVKEQGSGFVFDRRLENFLLVVYRKPLIPLETPRGE